MAVDISQGTATFFTIIIGLFVLIFLFVFIFFPIMQVFWV
jgi:hypothetical protein